MYMCMCVYIWVFSLISNLMLSIDVSHNMIHTLMDLEYSSGTLNLCIHCMIITVYALIR